MYADDARPSDLAALMLSALNELLRIQSEKEIHRPCEKISVCKVG